MAKIKKNAAQDAFQVLPFEKPIEDVRSRLRELEELAEQTSQDLTEELAFYRDRLQRLTEEIYGDLSPWDRVQVARHPARPLVGDFIERCCDAWVELHGDGYFGDDRAMVTGLATLDGVRVMLVGQRKGRDTKERMACNFGSAHPEGYRKALRKMRLAERLGLPVVCLVNTPGAYPGVGAEERGQARAIAENILEMFDVRVPIVAVVLGEGGSGGALGIAVADRVGMLENAWYSVISPEGCASILWHSAEGRDKAAEALKLTAGPLLRLGIIDEVVPEPVGGAHRDPAAALDLLKAHLLRWLAELAPVPADELIAARRRKFRHVAASLATLETALDPAQTGHEAPVSAPEPGAAPSERLAGMPETPSEAPPQP
jgi:acetyl-CoA carboxylase carboxyl transferase subunit alpha